MCIFFSSECPHLLCCNGQQILVGVSVYSIRKYSNQINLTVISDMLHHASSCFSVFLCARNDYAISSLCFHSRGPESSDLLVASADKSSIKVPMRHRTGKHGKPYWNNLEQSGTVIVSLCFSQSIASGCIAQQKSIFFIFLPQKRVLDGLAATRCLMMFVLSAAQSMASHDYSSNNQQVWAATSGRMVASVESPSATWPHVG